MFTFFRKQHKVRQKELALQAIANPKPNAWDELSVEGWAALVQDSTGALEHTVIDPSVYFSAIHINDVFWTAALFRWRKKPSEYKKCMNYLNERPRHNWSVEAFHTFGHALVEMGNEEDHERLYQAALLNNVGRKWLIDNSLMHERVLKGNDQELQQWIVATTHTMAQAPKAFELLEKLVRIGFSALRISSALEALWLQLQSVNISDPEDPRQLAKRAWHMSTSDLDQWMDTDKQLPWWFDPINAQSWSDLARIWSSHTRTPLAWLPSKE